MPEPVRRKFGKGNLTSPDIKYIQRIIFSGPGYNEVELTRPVWSSEDKSTLCLDDDICIEVDLHAEGVVAKGYILASSEIIYPAEFRGIAVRVRNVQIGEPGFLGFERVATGFIKSALSQITGEINVIHGLDAIDALNPGRESFYEENAHFKLLQSHVVGDKETVGGLLKKVIDELEKRMQVSSAVEDQLSRANQRRKALLSIAMAVTHFSRHAGGGLKKLFSDNTNHSNGLATLPKSEIGPGRTIQNFRVEERIGQDSYATDFINRIIYIDPEHDRWSRKISLLGEVYEVVPTNGSDEDPLCQLDLDGKKIFVNWGHPLRQQMGEAAFLKSSVAWRVAYHASQANIENMMELYLKLLTYNES